MGISEGDSWGWMVGFSASGLFGVPGRSFIDFHALGEIMQLCLFVCLFPY